VSSFRKRAPEGRGRDASGTANDIEQAERAALTLLARRDFAAQELAARLGERGFDAATVATIIAGLRERRALDDARFAGHFVAYRAARGQGPVRIERELADLGVAAEHIEAALREGPEWRSLAADVRRRRFGAAVPGAWSERSRQARFLQYRGFSADHIRSALGSEDHSEA